MDCKKWRFNPKCFVLEAGCRHALVTKILNICMRLLIKFPKSYSNSEISQDFIKHVKKESTIGQFEIF